MKNYCIIDEDGNKYWYCNDKLHRLDGPAVEMADGSKRWHVEGTLHRLDGPAMEDEYGKYWYFEGFLHRTDGPAIELENGYTEWYHHGYLFLREWRRKISILDNICLRPRRQNT